MAGEIVHIELPCQEVDRGQKFWNGLFGKDSEERVLPLAERHVRRLTGAPIDHA